MTCRDCERRNGQCTYHALVTGDGANVIVQALARLIDPTTFEEVHTGFVYYELNAPDRHDKFAKWHELALRRAYDAARRVEAFYG